MENKQDKGFTLVELLIVIVILGILATVTVFAVRGITDQGQTSACAADQKTLQVAVEAYYAKFGNDRRGGSRRRPIWSAQALLGFSRRATTTSPDGVVSCLRPAASAQPDPLIPPDFGGLERGPRRLRSARAISRRRGIPCPHLSPAAWPRISRSEGSTCRSQRTRIVPTQWPPPVRLSPCRRSERRGWQNTRWAWSTPRRRSSVFSCVLPTGPSS